MHRLSARTMKEAMTAADVKKAVAAESSWQ